MADTTFVDGVTLIPASWLNDVNDHTYNLYPQYDGLSIGTPTFTWDSAHSAIDISSASSIWSNSTGIAAGFNTYINSGSNRTKETNVSYFFAVTANGFSLYHAPSVTAGSAQTFYNIASIDKFGLNLPSNPCSCAADGGTQTRSSSTWSVMNGFTTELVDVGVNWNAADTFTAPTAGVYELQYTGTVGGAGPVVAQVKFYKNGTAIGGPLGEVYSSGSSDTRSITVQGMVVLAASDTIQVWARRSAGSDDCYLTNGVISIRRVQ